MFTTTKVKAKLGEDTLEIEYETIFTPWLEFEIKDDDVTKHEDIKNVSFTDCVMMRFPSDYCLLRLAPNFNCLTVSSTNFSRISSHNLCGYWNLLELYLDHNEIEELPYELFIYTPNLQRISFSSNKIKVIDEYILEPLKNLEYFNLRDNPGIDVCFEKMPTEDDYDDEFLSLAEFKKVIKRCKPVQDVWNIVNEQENLKRKFEAQEKEVIDLKRLCLDQGANIKGLAEKLEGQKKANDKIKKHCDALEKKLEEAKQDGAFNMFDFTIKINGKAFKVQKKILAAYSPLLAQMIRDNEDADTLELKDVSEEVFEEILNFMVKKTQPKPTANFIELYATSGYLQMKELMALCARTLMGKVTQENALEILCLCKKFPNKELQKKTFNEMKKIYDKP